MNHTYAEIELQLARTVDYLTSVVNASTQEDIGNLHMQILQAVDAQMEQLYHSVEPTDWITADKALLHVQDHATHKVYSRSLPLDYEENNNGISLKGETLRGENAEIAFLSNTALVKIKDLTGHGTDKAPCKNHD